MFRTISSQGIQCIGEYHFSGNAYVKDYCYIHNTFVPSEETDVSFDRSKVGLAFLLFWTEISSICT